MTPDAAANSVGVRRVERGVTVVVSAVADVERAQAAAKMSA
jgi:hypothetical protein